MEISYCCCCCGLQQGQTSHTEMMSGQHNWYACSHARPTYCNVCREALSGVTSHGLSCEGNTSPLLFLFFHSLSLSLECISYNPTYTRYNTNQSYYTPGAQVHAHVCYGVKYIYLSTRHSVGLFSVSLQITR